MSKTHTIRATAEQATALAAIASGDVVHLSSGNNAHGGSVRSYECSRSHGGSIAAHRCLHVGISEIYQLFRVWPNGQVDRI